jgi:hypothetical protein
MTEEFSPKFRITTNFSPDLIEQVVEDPIGNTTKQVIRLRDEGVRKALIAMGWTPPSNIMEGV